MKKIIFALLLLTGIALPQLHLGIIGGIAESKFYGNDVKSPEFYPDFCIGAYQEFTVSPLFTFQPEIFYIRKGSSTTVTYPSFNGSSVSQHSSVELPYIEVPLLMKAGISLNQQFSAHVLAGPTVAFLVSSRIRSGDAPSVIEDFPVSDITNVDYCITAGAGVGYRFNDKIITFDIRYECGLKSVSKLSPTIDAKNSSLLFLVGYSL